jgi:hypothetical protein
VRLRQNLELPLMTDEFDAPDTPEEKAETARLIDGLKRFPFGGQMRSGGQPMAIGDELRVVHATRDAGKSTFGQGWTLTKDALPPDETPVLAIRNGKLTQAEIRWERPGHEDTFEAFRFWAHPDDHWIGEWSLTEEITAWMPEPELPK